MRKLQDRSSLAAIEAMFSNPGLYEVARAITMTNRAGNRSARKYPAFMVLGFGALISEFRSARRVEVEISHPLVWGRIRRIPAELFPDDPEMRLPPEPMRRHHYFRAVHRWVSDPGVLAEILRAYREVAASQARELGLLDPDGPGSWTHPHPTRLLYGDAKVIKPLFKAGPAEARVDKQNDEPRQVRHDPDARLHFEPQSRLGAWGVKFVLVAAASELGPLILDLEWVPNNCGDADVAMACLARLAPLVPGAQAVVHDMAFRGVHHQVLLRDLGLMTIGKFTTVEQSVTEPRPAAGVERTMPVEDKAVRLSDGSMKMLRLYARNGSLGIGELTDTGELHFVELQRIRTSRTRTRSGQYRWYNDYALPEAYGAGQVMVRLDSTMQDRALAFDRTRYLRPIPHSDPDFPHLKMRRAVVESINRRIDDSLRWGRAYSVGHVRQHLDLLGVALMVNSVTLQAHRVAMGPERPSTNGA